MTKFGDLSKRAPALAGYLKELWVENIGIAALTPLTFVTFKRGGKSANIHSERSQTTRI
jgi:hypothetical protein